MAKQVAAVHGIPQPRHCALRAHSIDASTATALVADLGLPLFVKPANMGSSVGVARAVDRTALLAALAAAFVYDEWVLVEEEVGGREIEVGVLGDDPPVASVPGEIEGDAAFLDYENKYETGTVRLLVPADLRARVEQRLSRLAPDALFVSAHSRAGLDTLESRCLELIAEAHADTELLVPHSRYDVIARLYATGHVQSEEQRDDGVFLVGRFPPTQSAFFAPFVVKE